MADELAALRLALETSERERAAERRGRTRAERALREALSAAVPPSSPAEESTSSPAVYPLVPIGTLRSCFSTRNGTPRQPLLAPAARARLTLAPHVPACALDGLAEFSHCWVLYVFHANTNLSERLGGGAALHTCSAKVHVPRLNGGKRGVLSTRSPHRPCPIGLSVARVVSVQGNTLILAGLDCVDGSPILDVKPYLPFCDSLAGATSPFWAQAEIADGLEPLALAGVTYASGGREALSAAWTATEAARQAASRPARREAGAPPPPPPQPPLFECADAFLELVEQVLSRDIRATHQREAAAAAAAAGAPPPPPPASQRGEQTGGAGRWRVVLDGVNVGYELDGQGVVTVTDAHLEGKTEVAALEEPAEAVAEVERGSADEGQS